MKFDHDALEVNVITHAPISPLDGRVYFALQTHVFPIGDKLTSRPGKLRVMLLCVHEVAPNILVCYSSSILAVGRGCCAPIQS